MARHNHTELGLMPEGVCPACDTIREAQKVIDEHRQYLLEEDPVKQYAEAHYGFCGQPDRFRQDWDEISDEDKRLLIAAMRKTLVGFLEDLLDKVDEIEGTELKRTGHVGGFPIWLHTQDAVRDWISEMTDQIDNGEV